MVKHLMVIVCLVLLLVPAVEARKGWFRYKTPRYGFQMMVPFETAFHDKVWSGGWSGLVGTLQELKIYAMTLHGKVVSPEELEALALSKTETTKDQWNEVTEGSGNGWIWSRTIKIRKDDDVFFGSYGGSKTSSFLIFLHTTKDDFTAKEEAYQYWRKNVKLPHDAQASASANQSTSYQSQGGAIPTQEAGETSQEYKNYRDSCDH